MEDNTNARRFYEAQGFTATEDYLENDIGGKTLREVRYRLSRNRSNVDKY